MAKSKKGKQDKTSNTEEPKQGARRQFLRGAGIAVAAAGLISPLAKAQSADEKLMVNVPLDADKIQAIQKCLAKGTLRIEMSKTAAAGEKSKDPWLYD
jgi:hypothetical protein